MIRQPPADCLLLYRNAHPSARVFVSLPVCRQTDRGGVTVRWGGGGVLTDAVGSLTKQARKRQRSHGLIRAATGEHSEET